MTVIDDDERRKRDELTLLDDRDRSKIAASEFVRAQNRGRMADVDPAAEAAAAAEGAAGPPRDVFTSPDFNAVDFINRLFPDETHLGGVDPLIAKLRLRVRRVDDEILSAVRSQSTGGARAKADLENAQCAIAELNARIAEIKAKATQSEVMVQETCQDIKKLDYAKRHLTGTITALRRLSMLVGALEQLEQMAMRRQYRDSANLLEAVNQLATHFEGYNDIPKVASLQKKHADVRGSLRSHVIEDFHTTWQPTVIERDPGAAPRLADACLVVDALEPHVREELIGNITNKEMLNYATTFDGSYGDHDAKLESTERRYAWIKRNLKQKEEMWGVFPERWKVPQLLCMSLCKLTRTNLALLLDDDAGATEVPALLQALHRTIEFERDLDEYFGVGKDGGGGGGGGGANDGGNAGDESVHDDDDDDAYDGEDGASAGEVRAKYEARRKAKEISEQRGGRALPMDSAAAAVAKASFRGVISTCFEDHMGAYVELEERQLLEFVDQLVAEETWGKRTPKEKSILHNINNQTRSVSLGGAAAGEVLASAGQVFINIKKVFKRCSNLTRGKPLLALHGVFSRVLRKYAAGLRARAEAAGKILNDVKKHPSGSAGPDGDDALVDEVKCLCLIVNTAEYCNETVGPLAESMRRMLDGAQLKEAVDASDAEDEFAGCVGGALTTMTLGIEARAELASGIAKVNWSALEMVGDQSPYVDALTRALAAFVPTVKATVSANYFRFFCEKLAGGVAPKLYRATFKCKRFSDAGAQQFLLDLHAVKTILIDLPTTQSADYEEDLSGRTEKPTYVVPPAYGRAVTREMGKCEALVKVILSPHEGLGDTYRALLPDGTPGDFRAVCELKGMKKADVSAATEATFGRAGAQANLVAAGAVASSSSFAGGGGASASASSFGHHARGSSGGSGSGGGGGFGGGGGATGFGGGGGGGGGGGHPARTNSGGSGAGNKFGAMFKGLSGGGSGSSLNQMMDRAKDMTQKAAVGMKEMGEKAADGTRKLMQDSSGTPRR